MRIGSTGEIRLKIIIVTGLLLLVFSSYGLADDGDTLWTRVYGDTGSQMANSVVQTSDGAFVAAGYTGGYDNTDFWLIKFDANGDTLWTRTYGTDENEHAESVKQTYDGGFIMTGWVSFIDTFLYYNTYTVRTDAVGDTIWTWKYPGELYAYTYDVEQTPDSGFIIVGKTGGPDFDDYDAFLIRLDAAGDTVWTRVYGDDTNQDLFDVELTSDGGYVVTGHNGDCNDPTKYDVLFMKVAANGDSLWGHIYGGSEIDIGYSVVATADGGYIIAGCTESLTPGNPSTYFIKTDIMGDSVWAKSYGGGFPDEVFSIQQTYGGNYIATGYYGLARDTDVYLLKLDTNGDTLWTRTYGGSGFDAGSSVIQATDGSYMIAGGTNSFGAGNQDVYLLKILGPGSIAGYVSDDIERAPIESVYVSTGQHETWTDQYGYYILSDMLTGSYDVSLSHPGYQDTTVTGVVVTVGNTTSLDVQMISAGCDYVVGDVNGSDSYNGLDITYGVAFFKGGADPMCPYGSCPIPPCDVFFYCGDVNGSCSYNGLDITYGVAYFKGGPDPIPCADCPPVEIAAISRDEMNGN